MSQDLNALYDERDRALLQHRRAEMDYVDRRGEPDAIDESDPASVGSRGDALRNAREAHRLAERAVTVAYETLRGKHG